MVKTDHILSSLLAIHLAKPSDLIPSCRSLPIRVELDSLSRGHIERILTGTDGAR